jgi:2-keto-3-deoxy-L-fuconate dehydrogenase
MKQLEGKLCVLTAAGQGIGRATAQRFAADGARVIATSKGDNRLAKLPNIETVVLDVTDPAGITNFATEVGAVDVLFNCAGYVHDGSILDCDEASWDISFDVNVKSMYRMIRAFLPAMLIQGSGSIINMSSVASSITGVPDRFAYTASKAAVIGLTKSVAADFIDKGIRCNAICPGTIDTPSLHARMRTTGDYEKAVIDFKARQPMGRLGDPCEIAALASYLASDDSAFTTGQTHIIDGGWTT